MFKRRGKTPYVMSRRGRKTVVGLIALVITLFVYLDRGRLPSVAPSASTQKNTANASFDLSRYHQKTAKVVYTADGDTVDIDIPDGGYEHTRLRLLGVDTPETKKPDSPVMYYGPEASAYAKKVLLGNDVIILLDTISPTRDKYNRLLCYIQLGDGRIFNEMLIEEGFGYADLRFRHSFYKKYEQLQKRAIKNKKGLWEKVSFQELPGWLQRERPNLLDK